MVLLSAQGMDVAAIAKVAFTSEDRVRDVIRNFNADGFSSLYPKYKGGHPPTFTLPQRREIKKIAKSKPAEHDLPFSTWSLAKLADFLVAEGVVDDISHEGLRILLREEGVSFQRIKTWKTSKDPHYAAKKARVEHLYAIADREVIPEAGEPEVIFCVDEFGPLNLQPRPGTAVGRGQREEQGARPGTAAADARHLYPYRGGPAPARRLGTGRGQAVRAHQAAQDPGAVPGVLPLPAHPLPGHYQDRDHLRQLQPAPEHQAGRRVGTWASANNVEIAYTPTNSSWLNRIEAQFTALRYFALDGTDHASHKEQASMIRRYIIWRNNHAYDERLRRIVDRANVA